MPSPIETAGVSWRDGIPRSAQFDDIYYTAAGPDEVRHVFLAGNDLPHRWLGSKHFVVGETGFGAGLNFLATLKEWEHSGPTEGRLDYLSVEAFPLRRADLQLALERWPVLMPHSRELVRLWPLPEAGWHSLEFLRGRVRLLLMFGDAARMLAQCRASVDAWFLDGFTPARNPDMWSATLLRRVAQLTAVGGTVATFTVAGSVRRTLLEAGFRLHKRQGCGHKREVLSGVLSRPVATPVIRPWYAPPPVMNVGCRKAAVIGAGLAGCATAAALVREGWQVTLIDRQSGPATGASGNRAGVFMLPLEAPGGVRQQWHAAGYRHLLSYLHQNRDRVRWDDCGVLALADNPVLRRRYQALADSGLWHPDSLRSVAHAEAVELAGIGVSAGGLYLSRAGWVDPVSLCAAWLEDAGIALATRYQARVETLQRQGGRWSLRDGEGRELCSTSVVVLCAGVDSAGFAPSAWLPIRPVRGQLSELSAGGVDSGPRCVVSGRGYLLPERDGVYLLGASYDPDSDDTALRLCDHHHNLRSLRRMIPAWNGEVITGGRVAFRAATTDYLPLVGALPDVVQWQQVYADLQHGRNPQRYPHGPVHAGLLVVAGMGSRGLASAAIAARLVTALLDGTPLPVPNNVAEAVHPGRFLIRRLRRGQPLH